MSVPTARPVYNFAYKVAAEADQTYLAQSEERDGDNLSGVYSYVNPDGALITVNYEAGPDGFHQTLDQQDGFINTHQQPTGSQQPAALAHQQPTAPQQPAALAHKHPAAPQQPAALAHQQPTAPQQPDTIFSAKAEQSPTKLASQYQKNLPTVSKLPRTKLVGSNADTGSVSVPKNSLSSSSAPASYQDKQALINQVIAALQPDISAAVKAALEKTESVDSYAPVTTGSKLRNNNPALEEKIADTGKRGNPGLALTRQEVVLAEQQQAVKDKAPANPGPQPSRYKQTVGTGLSGQPSGVTSKGVRGNKKDGAPTSSKVSSQAGGDILTTFGSGHFVRIKTPDSEISY